MEREARRDAVLALDVRAQVGQRGAFPPQPGAGELRGETGLVTLDRCAEAVRCWEGDAFVEEVIVYQEDGEWGCELGAGVSVLFLFERERYE